MKYVRVSVNQIKDYMEGAIGFASSVENEKDIRVLKVVAEGLPEEDRQEFIEQVDAAKDDIFAEAFVVLAENDDDVEFLQTVAAHV